MKTIVVCPLIVRLFAVTVGFFILQKVSAQVAADSDSLMTYARQSISDDPTESATAMKALRAAGPAGVQALSAVYADEITGHLRPIHANELVLTTFRAAGPAGMQTLPAVYPDKTVTEDKRWDRIRSAFDSVGEQRDNYVSRLYWFTDLKQAEAAARASGKPILSLRLLGKLSDEYSCANSRFFRTTLYANSEVASYLRANFILHWQSVRPVPVITIDFGDGRKIVRTITGNSIHYILDAEGRPIDALPGLYGAKAFLAGLGRAASAEQEASALSGNERETFLKNYHTTQWAGIQRQFSHDLAQIGSPSPSATFASLRRTSRSASPTAISAAPLAIGKTAVERPMLAGGAQPMREKEGDWPTSITDSTWQAIAALHADDGQLGENAFNLVRIKQPDSAADAMRLAMSKKFVETPMMRMVRNLEHSIAEDTVRNEYELHARIHEWFAAGTAPQNIDALNRKVYAELFLTPDSDPWLGLAPGDVFCALDHGGLTQAAK